MAIVKVSTRQLLGNKRYIWFGLLAAAPTALFLAVSSTETDLLDLFLNAGVLFYLSTIGPIIGLTFASAAIGRERRDLTLPFVMLRPIPRLAIIGAKFLAAFLASFLLAGSGALALGVAYGMRSGDYGWIVPIVAATALALGAYIAVFVPLGYITARATLIGLGFVFIWENGIVFAVPGLAATSMWRIGFIAFTSLAPAEFDPEAVDFVLGTLQPQTGGALIRAAVFLMAGVLVTLILLRRRDLV